MAVMPLNIESAEPVTSSAIYSRVMGFVPGWPEDLNVVLLEGNRQGYPVRRVLAFWGTRYIALYVHSDDRVTPAQFRDDVYYGFLAFCGFDTTQTNEENEVEAMF